MPDRAVGAGWTEIVLGNEWNPMVTVMPPSDRVVEVWWMGQVWRGRYDRECGTWKNLDGVVMTGVTHWREIRE